MKIAAPLHRTSNRVATRHAEGATRIAGQNVPQPLRPAASNGNQTRISLSSSPDQHRQCRGKSTISDRTGMPIQSKTQAGFLPTPGLLNREFEHRLIR